MTMRFSDLVGSSAGAAAQYGFAITNGDGDIMADFRTSRVKPIGGSCKSIFYTGNQTRSRASVMAALSAGIVYNFRCGFVFRCARNLMWLSMLETHCTITNREGRALAVEYFSSN